MSVLGTIAEQRFGHGHSVYMQSLFSWFYSISIYTPHKQSALACHGNRKEVKWDRLGRELREA